MLRTQSEEFKALADRCAQEVIYGAFLDHAPKHEGAFYPVVENFVGLVIRNLQQVGQCLSADAYAILELTRPTMKSECDIESQLGSAEARAILGLPRPAPKDESHTELEVTSAEVRAILAKWTRPTIKGECDIEPALKRMRPPTHQELAASSALDILYRETIVRFEPLVVLAAMAHALRRHYQLLIRYGCQDYVEKSRAALLVHSFPDPSAFEH